MNPMEARKRFNPSPGKKIRRKPSPGTNGEVKIQCQRVECSVKKFHFRNRLHNAESGFDLTRKALLLLWLVYFSLFLNHMSALSALDILVILFGLKK